jgi:ribosome-associated protein
LKRTTILTPEKRGRSADHGRPEGDVLPRRRKTSQELLDTVLECLDDAKAEEVVSIDLNGKSSIADHMVVASGRAQRHVGAIADQLVERLRAAGQGKAKVEGQPACDWVLIDAGDVIVHVFRPEVRSFYNLEKLWSANSPTDRVALA